ncbi:MAG: hypothetical protein ACRENP_29710, partial [Longimicrobiales bacterium]
PSAIDFNGPASSVPATANVTISGAAGDNVETFVDLVTANGQLSLWFELAPSPATTRTWAGLNATVMQSTDYHGLVVFASPPNNESNFRLSLKYVGPVANQNIALGPQVNVPVTSPVAAGAYPRLRFQGTLPADYNKGATIDVVSPQPAGNAFSIVATNTYLAAAGNPLAYDFTMPDIAGLAGFPAAARLTSGTNDLTVSGVGFNGPGVFELRPTLGTELKAALRFANIIVP